jgi:DNA-damage-inducible protein D
MKRELIDELFSKFETARHTVDSFEFWSARELQENLGYSEWRNFLNVIEKAKLACQNSNGVINDHFVSTLRQVDLGKGGQREVDDISLSRYACYLIAQNGDPVKNEIAFAQTYFAVQTRKQEIIEKRLLDIDRVKARNKLTESEKKLSGIIYERGVDDKGFALIRSQGDKALFGGFSTNDMKKKLSIPDGRPLADFLPTLTIKAKDFAAELTSHNVVEKDLKGEPKISSEHIENNLAVRKMLGERGVRPEALPPSEDVKKISRHLDSEDKKVLKDGKIKVVKNSKCI